jgi:hypothetical protein
VLIPFTNTLILLGWERGLLQAEGEEVWKECSGCIEKVSKLIIFVLSIEFPKILKFVMICEGGRLGVGQTGVGGLGWDSILHFLLWELLSRPLSVLLEIFESLTPVQ